MDGATASQSGNRREAKLEASGTNKSRDVKIENFDLAYGERLVPVIASLFCWELAISNNLLYNHTTVHVHLQYSNMQKF